MCWPCAWAAAVIDWRSCVQVRKDVDADVKKAKADGEIGVEELCYDIYEEEHLSTTNMLDESNCC